MGDLSAPYRCVCVCVCTRTRAIEIPPRCAALCVITAWDLSSRFLRFFLLLRCRVEMYVLSGAGRLGDILVNLAATKFWCGSFVGMDVRHFRFCGETAMDW